MAKPTSARNGDGSFNKIFTDEDFIAAGELAIPLNGRIPSRLSGDSIIVSFMMPSTSASCLISHVLPGVLRH